MPCAHVAAAAPARRRAVGLSRQGRRRWMRSYHEMSSCQFPAGDISAGRISFCLLQRLCGEPKRTAALCVDRSAQARPRQDGSTPTEDERSACVTAGSAAPVGCAECRAGRRATERRWRQRRPRCQEAPQRRPPLRRSRQRGLVRRLRHRPLRAAACRARCRGRSGKWATRQERGRFVR